jgi:beta-barrel assembly-enhancing protease
MNTYEAILIHPEIKGGRTAGQLTIKNNQVLFICNQLEYSISLTNLSITAGGAANRFVFFADKFQKDISIYTSDKKILKDPILKNNPQFSIDIKKSKSNLNKTLKGSLILLGIVFALIGGLYLLKDKMVEGLANQVPVEWETEAGDKLFKTLSAQYKVIKNDSLEKEFIKIAKPLFAQVEKKGYKIDLYFVEDSTINAFALPGGKVIIQTGLIKNAKSWEEVMGVLSHELSHVTRRHHIRGIINNIGVFGILSAALGDVSALAGTFASFGGELALLSNSRAFETEADETGWNYMVNAKMNPKGMIDFFETLKKEDKKILDETPAENIDLSFLSTHPETQERIDNLKIKLKADKTVYPPITNNFKEFKENLLN